jgi:peptidoglycan/LPS O-acetylase OafA/YrhL
VGNWFSGDMTTRAPANPAISLDDLASKIPASRNRAVDALRVGAMCMVAVGHWLAADIRVDGAGTLIGGSGLAAMPALHPLTWIFQVMPLFFCVGGFANAASLASATRNGTPATTWIGLRLRRLLGPVAWFATAWLAIVGVGTAVGAGAIVAQAASLAVIPLWFLAIYVLDIALSPTLVRAWNRWHGGFAAALVAIIVVLDLLRVAGFSVAELPNALIGWSCFQVMGIAWHSGWLTSTRRLAIGFIGAVVAVAAVGFGPWPVSMVQVPGMKFSNTWPPSLALIAFGMAQCMLAVSLAPRLDRRLAASKILAKAVVVGGSCSMSVYLWHLSAFALAGAIAWPLGLLTSAPAGSLAAFAAKLPVMVAAAAVLGAIVSQVARKERSSMLDKRTINTPVWMLSMMVPVLVVSFETLTQHGFGHPAGAVSGAAIVATEWVLRRRSA